MALESQPNWEFLTSPVVQIIAWILFIVGSILVGSTYYRLKITGTYLGDYFGILMESRVTGFPFNVLNDPMYDGSSMIYAAQAIWSGKPAGLLLALWIFVVYKIAIIFEGYKIFFSFFFSNYNIELFKNREFTDYIYSEASKKKKTN